jgi:hypothetical protein
MKIIKELIVMNFDGLIFKVVKLENGLYLKVKKNERYTPISKLEVDNYSDNFSTNTKED